MSNAFGVTPKKNFRINPIAKEVQDVFDGIYAQVSSFVKNPHSAINGMIVSGDAGTGKTFTVKKALIDAGHQQNTEYIKGSKITAANLYVKLYLNRHKHRIIVLDDCDLIHNQEKNLIIPMLLGAVDLGQNRDIGWETAKKNALMEEYEVPHSFRFDASVIWITNDRKGDIGKSIKQWKNAIFSRFNFAECNFTEEQKFMYTLHLVENFAMLGENCQEYNGGYSEDTIMEATNYMGDNYRNLVEVTPRIAIKIADILQHNQDEQLRKSMLKQLWK
jgi:Cdc6-like AAA superfamily ATPase